MQARPRHCSSLACKSRYAVMVSRGSARASLRRSAVVSGEGWAASAWSGAAQGGVQGAQRTAVVKGASCCCCCCCPTSCCCCCCGCSCCCEMAQESGGAALVAGGACRPCSRSRSRRPPPRSNRLARSAVSASRCSCVMARVSFFSRSVCLWAVAAAASGAARWAAPSRTAISMSSCASPFLGGGGYESV